MPTNRKPQRQTYQSSHYARYLLTADGNFSPRTSFPALPSRTTQLCPFETAPSSNLTPAATRQPRAHTQQPNTPPSLPPLRRNGRRPPRARLPRAPPPAQLENHRHRLARRGHADVRLRRLRRRHRPPHGDALGQVGRHRRGPALCRRGLCAVRLHRRVARQGGQPRGAARPRRGAQGQDARGDRHGPDAGDPARRAGGAQHAGAVLGHREHDAGHAGQPARGGLRRHPRRHAQDDARVPHRREVRHACRRRRRAPHGPELHDHAQGQPRVEQGQHHQRRQGGQERRRLQPQGRGRGAERGGGRRGHRRRRRRRHAGQLHRRGRQGRRQEPQGEVERQEAVPGRGVRRADAGQRGELRVQRRGHCVDERDPPGSAARRLLAQGRALDY